MIKNEEKYDSLFRHYGAIYSIDWLFLKAQCKQESRFDPNAENKTSHAKGLMQFMDRTWQEWGDLTPGIQDTWKKYNPFNPEDSIAAGAAYMNNLRAQVQKRLFDKNDWMPWTLCCYNWGPGYMFGFHRKDGSYFKGIMQRTDNFKEAIKDLPAETKIYVANISSYYNEYKDQQEAKEKELLNYFRNLKAGPVEDQPQDPRGPYAF